ncbi:hypothetical protein PR002_g14243 [Phytophthora rubi]|uniref:Uncharacterized protein n=1 Tax=Phytophthora rubi TaxID=129364 RepID=A0A6A3LEV3_9STRA|nr:hypothetical protein PR002_g14243 [Phytophthora rubi]
MIPSFTPMWDVSRKRQLRGHSDPTSMRDSLVTCNRVADGSCPGGRDGRPKAAAGGTGGWVDDCGGGAWQRTGRMIGWTGYG